jgi:hypothetical protein
MSVAADSAAQRVADLKKLNEHAVSLARYASLAVRIDAPLLRRLRLELLPRADASAEADLWFSALAESRGDDAWVLDPDVSEHLRAELATELLDNGHKALDVAWLHTKKLHESLPESLRLEEALTYLALSEGAAAASAIEEALQPAMIAMASGEKRAVEIARWVVRAVPRLPAAARNTEAAVALAVAAMALLGTGLNVLGAEVRAMPHAVGWLVPSTAFSRRIQLTCDISTDGLYLLPPRGDEAPGSLIDLPLTRPLLVELRWKVGIVSEQRLSAVKPHELVPLPAGWHDLHLVTLDGASYEIHAARAARGEANYEDLLRACVGVRAGGRWTTGVVVAPQRVLTTLNAVGTEGTSEPIEIEVRRSEGTSRSTAHVEASDSRLNLALLAAESLPNLPPMPRTGKPVEPGSSVAIITAPVASGKPSIMHGTVVTIDVDRIVEGRTHTDLIGIKPDEGRTPPLGTSGSPVIQDHGQEALDGVRRVCVEEVDLGANAVFARALGAPTHQSDHLTPRRVARPERDPARPNGRRG